MSDQEVAATRYSQPPWRIGVDVGGTFTDMVLADASGRIQVFKVPSVPDDPGKGAMAALALASSRLDMEAGQLLAYCELFLHGSTVATNTLVEGNGATVGMLTTEGFRDSLEIRRGLRANQWDHRRPYPPVLVPRHRRLPVRGRIDRDGVEIAPLNRDDVAAALKNFQAEGVESIAICLINSFANPLHEQACAEVVRANAANFWTSVSTDIVPIIGEFERASTTVVNAYLTTRVVSYLKALNDELGRLGLPTPMLLLQSNGGAVSVDQVATRPVNMVLSGPAAGVGALSLYGRAIGNHDLISMEIGGTSCDVALMSAGRVAVTDEFTIAGYHVSVPSIDIHTVGAGGGTIAGVDGAGMLYVGPRGAGARPGPACYGFGGAEPTVTDAQLVLGRLRPGPYADGAIVLDEDSAREAIERVVARPLGIEVDAAAAGIIRLLEQTLLHAVERMSIERGHDPRRFTLVAAGGAGPMHGAVVGRALGCRRAYIPRQAGVFCALGMLHADVRQDYVQVYLAPLEGAGPDAVEHLFRGLEARARAQLENDGFHPDRQALERELDLRYRGQQWPVRVVLGGVGGFEAGRVRAAFEAEYERLYGHIQPGGLVEITGLRVTGRGRLPPLSLAAAPSTGGDPRPVARRSVYHGAARGRADTAIYAGADLELGCRLDGPLLVEEVTTTVYVGPDDVLEVDNANNFVIHLVPRKATHGH